MVIHSVVPRVIRGTSRAFQLYALLHSVMRSASSSTSGHRKRDARGWAGLSSGFLVGFCPATGQQPHPIACSWRDRRRKPFAGVRRGRRGDSLGGSCCAAQTHQKSLCRRSSPHYMPKVALRRDSSKQVLFGTASDFEAPLLAAGLSEQTDAHEANNTIACPSEGGQALRRCAVLQARWNAERSPASHQKP